MNSSVFRGTNVCHRLELPSRPRRSIRRRDAARPRRGAVHSPGGSQVLEGGSSVEGLPQPESVSPQPDGFLIHPQAAIAPVAGKDIEVLQRRLKKLSALLELQEGQLRRVAQRLDEDPGIASVHESVQGLDPQDPEADRKREMMARIFEANLALRGRS